MKSLSSAILQPTVIGLGASIFLFSYNNNLKLQDYFLHLPFWIGFVRPSGLYWQSKILKEVNKDVFPPQMKAYREMYLVSKNAVLYDVVLNHTIYHSFLATTLLAYMYAAKSFVDNAILRESNKSETAEQISQKNSLGYILKSSALTLVQGRALISCVSIISEYLVAYLSLKKQGTSLTYSMPVNAKRFLLIKQILLSWSWSGLILKEFFKNYTKTNVQSAQ